MASSIDIKNDLNQSIYVCPAETNFWAFADILVDAAALIAGFKELKTAITALNLPAAIQTLEDLRVVTNTAAGIIGSATTGGVGAAELVKASEDFINTAIFGSTTIEIKPGTKVNVRDKSILGEIFTPSGWASLLGVNTMSLYIITADKKKTANFMVNEDSEWVASATGIDFQSLEHKWISHDQSNNENSISLLAGDNINGPVIYAHGSIIYMNSYENMLWHEVSDPPFKPTHMCGDNRAGPCIANGRKVARMDDYGADNWTTNTDAPFDIIGMAGQNKNTSPYIIGEVQLANLYEGTWKLAGVDAFVSAPPIVPMGLAEDGYGYGPIIYNGKDVRYFDIHDHAGGWKQIAPAPFDIKGIAGNNAAGPIVYNGRRVAYMDDYGANTWHEVAKAPFEIQGIAGENSKGVIAYNGSNLVRMDDYGANTWKWFSYPSAILE